jgi:hypothetical protein
LVCEKVKLVVKLILPNGHKCLLLGWESSLFAARLPLVSEPHCAGIFTPLDRIQFGHGNTECLGKKANLYVGHNAALCFDVSKNVTGHVAPQQLNFCDKFFLRPIPLIPELGYILSDEVGFVLHGAPCKTADSRKPDGV